MTSALISTFVKKLLEKNHPSHAFIRDDMHKMLKTMKTWIGVIFMTLIVK